MLNQLAGWPVFVQLNYRLPQLLVVVVEIVDEFVLSFSSMMT